MLTKTDLKNIDDLIKNGLKTGFAEFFETLTLPYFEENEKTHKVIREELKEGLAEIGEHIKDDKKKNN